LFFGLLLLAGFFQEAGDFDLGSADFGLAFDQWFSSL
jgi:hypothetical protein